LSNVANDIDKFKLRDVLDLVKLKVELIYQLLTILDSLFTEFSLFHCCFFVWCTPNAPDVSVFQYQYADHSASEGSKNKPSQCCSKH
jgi:hypothetical protein